MAQVYFHCSNSREVRIDRSGEAVSDLAEARDRAACIVRWLIMRRDAEDWRDWVVHVSDDFDDEIFVLPFAFVLGKVAHRFAGPIDPDFPRVRAVEINLGHVGLL